MRTGRLFIAILVAGFAGSGFAKMYEIPRSFALLDKSQEQVQRKVLPKVDRERLMAEDQKRGKTPPRPLRFAIPIDVDFNLNNSGTWQTVPDGRVWRLRIQSPDATSHNLGITRFSMPDGAKLWIYGPDHKQVEGPYTARNRSHLGSLWTPVIGGDEIVVEVFVPTGVSQPVVGIRKVNQGYRAFYKTGLFGGSEGACEIDVICPQGVPWQNQIRAVNVFTINGTGACTGTLLNNVALDRKPYVLSAAHCGVTTVSDATVVVFWNFQSPTCGTHAMGPLTDTQTGSQFRASSALPASDFVLFELDQEPDPTFNVFYSGWDATGAVTTPVVCIHQPSADVKAISFSSGTPITTNPSASLLTDVPSPTGTHLRVEWSVEVTEPGSSGSCIFDTTNQRCVGTLSGGPSACGVPAASLHDYYGRFSVSWTGGGTNATRLSNWLDPANTGTLSLAGDPHNTTADGIHYDFQGAGEYVALRDPSGLEVQARQTAVATTFNPGADPYDGLATCVSLNSAVAARVNNRRVSIQPNISGVPDPTGLQVRVDGVLTTVGAGGVNLGPGGRIIKSAVGNGYEVDFPSGTALFVTPLFWNSQGKWYMNVDVIRSASSISGIGGTPGGAGTGGIMAARAAGSWLPALPDGTSMGPMPASLHQRYVDLYQRFGEAWRVKKENSLFDYAPGTSTDTFTLHSWPLENPPCVIPQEPAAIPLPVSVARSVCANVLDKNMKANCIFDVRVTGERGFAKLYLLSQRIRRGSTRTTVYEGKDPTRPGEAAVFTAVVATRRSGVRSVPAGTVQFTVDGKNAGEAVMLDKRGRAVWRTSNLGVGEHVVGARFTPVGGSALLASSSLDEAHTVTDR
jgi:lysyl endopeptidase